MCVCIDMHMHIHMRMRSATDARASTVRRALEAGLTPALIPGGFSEAVYTNASPTEECAYMCVCASQAQMCSLHQRLADGGVRIHVCVCIAGPDLYVCMGPSPCVCMCMPSCAHCMHMFMSACMDMHRYAYLAERTGFVRLAIEAGADIIPAYTCALPPRASP